MVNPQAAVAVRLPDVQVLADLTTYLGRATRIDPGGATRMVGHAEALAVYVAALHGAGGPTVLGLRVAPLARACDADLTLPLSAVAAGLDRALAGGGAEPEILLSGDSGVGASWAGITPPRQGWRPEGLVEAETIRAAARAGVRAVMAGVPPGAGAAAVAALRARVWAGPLAPGLELAPAGVAFAAEGLGFLSGQEPAALYRCGAWSRLTTPRGHVLARGPLLA